MKELELTAAHSPEADLNVYMEMGNEAIKYGDESECLKWYSKGLAMARQLKNPEKEHLFSNLIITLI